MYLRPYNGSLFDLRNEYLNIFPEPEFAPIDESKEKSSKIFKISFHINLLTTMCDHFKYNRITKKYDYVSRETDLLQVCTDSGELDIFE